MLSKMGGPSPDVTTNHSIGLPLPAYDSVAGYLTFWY